MISVGEMRRENIKNEEKLNELNNIIFTDIVCYLMGSKLNERQVEEVRADILDMFLMAQDKDEDVNKIIGKDYKAFCDSVIDAIGEDKITKAKIKENIEILLSCIMILLTIDVVPNFAKNILETGELQRYNFSMGTLITGIIISFASIFLVVYICKNSFKITRDFGDKFVGKVIIFFLVGFFVFILGLIGYKLRNVILFTVNQYIILGILIVYWGIVILKTIKNKMVNSL